MPTLTPMGPATQTPRMSSGRPSRPLRVALLSHDPWEQKSDDVRPFNYGVRRIQAAILGHPELAESNIALIESTSLDPAVLAAQLEAFDPDVVGVSAYVWSFPVLLEVARRAKRVRPDRLVIFGGPSSRPEMCELPQHSDTAEVIDVLVTDEGESCMQQILLSPDWEPSTFARIPGLALHDGHRWQRTATLELGAPDRYPSPYQMGLVPQGITCEVETFRGCPLSCTFCEWGDTGTSGRMFGYEYLLAELDAIGKLDSPGAWLVDAGLNLNAKAFRNLQRAEAETGALKKLGNFRCEIYPSQMTDEHLRFLEDCRTAYTGIGLQSFDEEVLKGVDRRFKADRFERVVRDVGAIVPGASVEVMMGLPGDNPDNFKRTFERARKLPVNLRVFHTLVLPGALMTKAPPSFELVFDPFNLKVLSCQGWSRTDIEETCRWLDSQLENPDWEPPGTWRFYRTDRPRRGDEARRGDEGEQQRERLPDIVTQPEPERRGTTRDVDLLPGLREAIERLTTAAGWTLTDVVAVDADVSRGLVISVSANEVSLELHVGPAVEGRRAYKSGHGLAYSYERATGTFELAAVDELVKGLHPLMRAALLGYRKPGAAKGLRLDVLPS
jgi:radical SAM superfamily enzyme YgiQ (UPF0313 family)